MATRSAIGIMHGNNCKMVYCHWDGYLSHNGKILLENYDSPKTNHLVALGNLSSLGTSLGEKHPFSEFELDQNDPEYDAKVAQIKKAKELGWCTFYGRDRGETDTEYKVFDNFVAARDYYQDCGCEYIYIMRDGEWFVTSGDMTGLLELRTALKMEEEAA